MPAFELNETVNPNSSHWQKLLNICFFFRHQFYLLHFKNDSNEIQRFEREIDSTYIQIHFCLRGKSKFLFNNGSYSFDVLGCQLHFAMLSATHHVVQLSATPCDVVNWL